MKKNVGVDGLRLRNTILTFISVEDVAQRSQPDTGMMIQELSHQYICFRTLCEVEMHGCDRPGHKTLKLLNKSNSGFEEITLYMGKNQT